MKLSDLGLVMQAKVLLLEDDDILSEILCEFLEEEGFSIECCNSASDALNLAYEKQFDIWLLDVKVPLGEDFTSSSSYLPGFELLKLLREANKTTPCIFITSLSSVFDIKDGYDVGCDDFLKKPFELLELKCRIQTLLKRTFDNKNEILDLGDGFSFNLISKTLYKDSSPLALTKKEAMLLHLLLKHTNSYVSINIIFETLWEYDKEPVLLPRVY